MEVPKSQSIGIGTSDMLAVEGSGFLSISDRALLRRFPGTASASSSFSCTKQVENSFLSSSASVVPFQPGEDAKDTTKKRKRFIWNTKKASICLDTRDNILQKQEQADTPCGFPPKVAASAGLPPTLSSTSVLGTRPPDFALLYFTLVQDNAVPLCYLQEFLSLEIPARRAAKRLLISAASITDSMAAADLKPRK